MAAIVADPSFQLAAFHAHLTDRLPHYARPLFLRIRAEMDTTGTFKYSKADLVRQGYDPAATSDALYFSHPAERAFVPLDAQLYKRIQSGEVRL
jgi:fatty-acyl-CoA synthase